MARHKKADRNQVMTETRRSLLAAAAKEFAARGYSGANVNRMANAAGFAIGTVYNYFPSKEDLMLAFIDDVAQSHVDFIVSSVHQVPDPEGRLSAFFESGFAFVATHFTQAKAIFNALNGPDEGFRLHLFQAYQPLFQLLSDDILGPGIAQNIFRKVDPGSTAGLLMLVYLGTGSQLSPEGEHWLEASAVADFALRALRP